MPGPPAGIWNPWYLWRGLLFLTYVGLASVEEAGGSSDSAGLPLADWMSHPAVTSAQVHRVPSQRRSAHVRKVLCSCSKILQVVNK